MKFKVVILAIIFFLSSGIFVSDVFANTCPTSNPSTGVGCTLDNQNYFCNGSCQINSSVPSCMTWTPSPIIAPNYATTTTTGLRGVSTSACTAADACGVCSSCGGGYPNKCGDYPNIFCKADFTPTSGDSGYVTNCSTYNACTEKCSTCSNGYSLCLAQNKCTQTLSCPGQTFNSCTGACEGTISTLKLDYDSGGTSAGTTVKQSGLLSSILNIILGSGGTSLIGIGTNNPASSSLLTISAGTGIGLNMSLGRISNLSDPIFDADAVTKGYADDLISSTVASSSIWQLLGNNTYYNNGNVGIGTTTPSAKLQVTLSDANSVSPALFLQNNQSKLGGIRIYPVTDAVGGYFSFGGSVTTFNNYPQWISSDDSSRQPGVFGYTARGSSPDSRFYFMGAVSGSNKALSEIFSILNNGNVGIGTTSPVNLLDIGSLSYGAPVYIGVNTAGNSGQVAGIKFKTSTGSATSYIQQDSYGSYNISTGSYGHGLNFASGRSSFSNFLFRNSSDNLGVAIVEPGYSVSSLPWAANLLIGGNVGIGTTTPSSKLSFPVDTAKLIDLGGGRIGNVSDPASSTDAATKGYVDLWINNNSFWSKSGSSVYYNGGNVGIGTSSPIYKLQVLGDIGIGANNKLWLYANTNMSATSNAFQFNTTQNNGWTFNNSIDGSNERVRITAAGDVGIGTISPGVKLDVVGGSIRTSNQLISTVGYGTAPFSVISTTTVTNLTANYLGFGSVGATPSSSPYAKLTAGIITLPEFGAESGTITIRGWSSSYYSWQLIGNNTPWNRPDLYFRTGPDGSWGTTYRLWHSGNLTNGLATSSVVKWGGSSLANTIMYENGTGVGIGTSTPAFKLTFPVDTAKLVDLGGGRLGNLSDPVTSTDAVNKAYVDLLVSSSTANVSSVAKFVGATTNTYSGNNTGTGGNTAGYTAAKTICNNDFPGSHVCSSFEIVNSIALATTPAIPFSSTLWIFNGPPGYTWNSNDCNGRTSITTGDYGTVWVKLTSGDGFGSLENCGTPRKLACCK